MKRRPVKFTQLEKFTHHKFVSDTLDAVNAIDHPFVFPFRYQGGISLRQIKIEDANRHYRCWEDNYTFPKRCVTWAEPVTCHNG